MNPHDVELEGTELELNLDGQRSRTPGPCPCGYKHWLEGKEYDFLVRYNTSQGIKTLGFNAEDNAYNVARNFISKHNLNEDCLDDTMMVNTIAEHILKSTSKKSSVDKPKNKKDDKEVAFDPYRPSISVPNHSTVYNKAKQSFETTMYLTKEKQAQIEKERKQREEEAKKQNKLLQSEQAKVKEITEHIKTQAENDRRERQLKFQNVQTVSPAKKYSNTVPVMIDGELKYVEKSTVKRRSDEHMFSTIANLSEEHDHDHGHGHDHRHHQRYIHDEDLPYNPPEVWSIPSIVMRLQQYGVEKVERDMAKAGFSELDRSNTIKLAMLILKTEEIKRRKQEEEFIPRESNTKFPGMGNALSSSGEKQNWSPTDFGRLSLEETHSPSSGSSNELEQFPDPPQDSIPHRTPKPIEVDPSQPMTTIVVFLHNGKKETIRCNHSHTIGDVRDHLDSLDGPLEYQLMPRLNPKKILSDLGVTVKDAGLLQAAVLQSRK